MSDESPFSIKSCSSYSEKECRNGSENQTDFNKINIAKKKSAKSTFINYANTIQEIQKFLQSTNSDNLDEVGNIEKIKNKNIELSKIGTSTTESIQNEFVENVWIHETIDNQGYIIKINETIDDLIKQKTRMQQLELNEYRLQNNKLNQSLLELKQKSGNQQNTSITELIAKISGIVRLHSQQTSDVLELQIEFEKLIGHNLKNQIQKILSDLIKCVADQEYEIKNLKTEITEKEKKLNQTERLSAIGELTSRVAHDLRNPLSVMKGSIDLLKIKNKINFDESLSRHYEIMDRAISRMSAQIEDVLDFIRPVPLKASKNSLLETIRHSMEKIKFGANILVTLPENDIEFEYDDKKIDVVFDNILTNAKQAISGEGKIVISFEETQKEIIIKIQDSGEGIPEDIMDSIFDPLVTTKQTGTGLGLASCLRIIQDHHGNISVSNNPTIFCITLPKIQKR